MQGSWIKTHLWQFLFVVLVMGLCQACAKSKLTSSWTNDSYEGPIKGTILVIGVFKEPVAHKIFEESFVAELRKAGRKALPSYKYGLGTTQPSKEELQQAVKQSEASTILITHLLSENSSHYQFPEKRYAYAGSMTWDNITGYHSTVYAEVWGGNKSVDKTVDYMEAALFDGKSGKHLWSARSKSVNLEKLLRKDDEQLEEVFIKDLKSHKLI